MTSRDRPFVSFRPGGGGFVGFIDLRSLDGSHDVEAILGRAVSIYASSVCRMSAAVAIMAEQRKRHLRVPARMMWALGDAVFDMQRRLAEIPVELDGVYDHLCRDLNVKRKWLEKAIVFRRHLPDVSSIPENLNWGKCEKGTRKAAKALAARRFEEHEAG